MPARRGGQGGRGDGSRASYIPRLGLEGRPSPLGGIEARLHLGGDCTAIGEDRRAIEGGTYDPLQDRSALPLLPAPLHYCWDPCLDRRIVRSYPRTALRLPGSQSLGGLEGTTFSPAGQLDPRR